MRKFFVLAVLHTFAFIAVKAGTNVDRLRGLVDSDLSILFQLLPRKFTAAQLRSLWQNIYRTTVDVRNFHKKIASMEYVVPLDERQQGVAHRAARYYKFDRRIYNKSRR